MWGTRAVHDTEVRADLGGVRGPRPRRALPLGRRADADFGDGPGMVGTYISEVCWWSARPLTFLIWAGVFERHPKLKVAVTESTTIWVPELLQLLDFRYEDTPYSAKLGNYTSHLSMKPSDYFRRNVLLGARHAAARSRAAPRDRARRHHVGHRLPAPEGSWPETAKKMRDVFHGLPEPELAAMLGGNAARVLRVRHREAGAAGRTHRSRKERVPRLGESDDGPRPLGEESSNR